MSTCPGLNLAHQYLSQPVKASFSQSEEVFYRRHITISNDVHYNIAQRWQNLDVIKPKMQFISNFDVM